MTTAAAALLQGGLITIMIWCNGRLAAGTGPLPALVFIQGFGLLAALVALTVTVIRKKGLSLKKIPLHLCTGGLMGVGVVLLQNHTFNAIGAAMTVAATLTGQIFISLMIDTLGLFSREKQPLSLHRLTPVFLMLLGLTFLAR